MKKNVIFENFPSKYLERIDICCTFALASLLKMVLRRLKRKSSLTDFIRQRSSTRSGVSGFFA